MIDTIRTPVLASAAHVCFKQCATWIILCGGVGLAASIIEHNRTPLAKFRTAENRTMASGNSFIKIIQSETQHSLLERLSPRHHVQAHVLQTCATVPSKRSCGEEVETSQEKEVSHHKEPRVLKKRRRPSKKEIWPLKHLTVSSGHRRECRLQKKYKSRSKHQPDRWIDAIDSEEYVNPHLMSSLQSDQGLWNLSLSYMQLTAVVY